MPKFYFSPLEVPAISPAVSSNWTNFLSSSRGVLRTLPFGKADYVSYMQPKTVATNPTNSGIRQFISDPLPNAGTLSSGTSIIAVVPLSNNTISTDAFMRVSFRIVSNNGSVVRGTAFEGTNETTVVTSGAVNNRDLHTSLSPRVISSTTTSTVNWQVGDRLVIEIGVRFVTSTTGDQAVAAFSSSAEFIGDIVQAHSSAYVDRRPWISIGEPLLFGPPTDAEEFRYGLDGYPLNGNTSTLPFVDFERIDGLDSAPIRSSVSDREGQHGGFATAEFEGPRTVTLEGRLYCAPSALEAELDRLKANFSPTTIDKPLFFGTDTGETRLVRGKSLGVRYVKDRERGIGVIKFQIQIVCQDPRIYLGAEETFTTSNTLTVAGNRETPLRLSLRPSTGTINNPSVTITNALGIWTISYTGSLNVSSDEVTLDMGARTAILNGSVNVRHLITLSNGWASLSPGANTFAPSTNLALDKYYQPAVW